MANNPNTFNNQITRQFSRKLYLSKIDNAKHLASPTPLYFLRQADTTSFILLADGSSKLMRAEV